MLTTFLEVTAMPSIYLSPSTQQSNETVLGKSEEYYMNLIADAMIPYLNASSIAYVRNTPQMTALESARQSNLGNYDLHLAIHSNAAGVNNLGGRSGAEFYYYPGSANGLRAAVIFANNYKEIYPNPSNVRIQPLATLIELNKTKAPALLAEVGFHDNIMDASWIVDNIEAIARNLAVSVADYLNVPLREPNEVKNGVVNIRQGYLNVRSAPDMGAFIVATLSPGTQVSLINSLPGWYYVNDGETTGFVSSNFVTLL